MLAARLYQVEKCEWSDCIPYEGSLRWEHTEREREGSLTSDFVIA